MSEEKPHSHSTQGPCAFCELRAAAGRFMEAFGPSEKVSGHFRQSRLEFLKGVRAMLDERIEDRGHSRKGTRVVVE